MSTLIVVDLAGAEHFKGPDQGVFDYYDNYDRKALGSNTTEFRIPAAYYPLKDRQTNSGRMFSYLKKDGMLMD